MKILWLSNCRLTNSNPTSTGSWLYSMAFSLIDNGVELYNITSGNVIDVEEISIPNLQEWVLPSCKLTKEFLPSDKIIKKIQAIINTVDPQVIHIWGLEGYWSRLSWKGYITGPVLLEMQGLLSSCAEFFYGGLTNNEKRKCYRLKEILSYKHSLPYQKKLFESKGRQEPEILRQHDFISTQSDWVRSRIMPFVSKNCYVFKTDIAVRKCFLESEPWKHPDNEKPTILAISSGAIPYKGLHIALKALQIVKKQYENVELRIIGDYAQHSPFWRKSGYVKFLEDLINQLGLKENVKFLGLLDANHIVTELLNANIFLQSSFVESYSLTVAEALSLGVPSVISYAGAMPELAIDNDTALFYNPTDYYKCAYQLQKIIMDTKLAERLSSAALVNARNRHNAGRVFQIQLDIYNKFIILYNNSGKHA